MSRFGVESYNLSISTLEEVFLRVGHLDDPSLREEEQPRLETDVKTSERR